MKYIFEVTPVSHVVACRYEHENCVFLRK